MHDVVVKGSGLIFLLADFASQQITGLKEPARVDKFASSAGPRISGLKVRVETKGSTGMFNLHWNRFLGDCP
jgi:hypothetical protein